MKREATLSCGVACRDGVSEPETDPDGVGLENRVRGHKGERPVGRAGTGEIGG